MPAIVKKSRTLRERQSQLIPRNDVRPGDEPGSWQAAGLVASFLILETLPVGWIRVRFAFRCDVPLRLEIHAETDCLDRLLPTRFVNRNHLLHLEHPVASLRIEVIGIAPGFHLSDVQVETVPVLVVLAQGLGGKLALLRRYGGPWSALGRGLRLFLQGRFRTLVGKLFKALRGPVFDAGIEYDADQAYDDWRRKHTLQPEDRTVQQDWLGGPLLSVILIGGAEGNPLWQVTLASIRRQTYARWELLLDEDGSNRAIDRAQGEFVVFLHPGDELAEQALFRLARAVVNDPNTDLVIADEDEIDPSGRHRNPFFKPTWSPETLLEQSLLCPFLGVRTSLLRDLGNLRGICGRTAVYDLVLRVAARSSRVQHIADVLMHLRTGNHLAEECLLPERVNALRDHLQETRRPATIEAIPGRLIPRVRFHIEGNPLVSIIIPTAFARHGDQDDRVLVLECVRGLRTLSTWKNHEIIVVASRAIPDDTSMELARYEVTIVPLAQHFNFASAINRGAAEAQGSQLLLLNDDTEVITPDWLECMLEYAQQSDIGAVGARLLFPHGRIQHAGIHFLNGQPLHAFYGYPSDHPGHRNNLLVPCNVSAVTGACLMTRRALFEELGGMDPEYPLDGNDIDYCLRVTQTGRRIVCTPYAQLIHHEAFTRRGRDSTALAALRTRWGRKLERDPYYNANFNQSSADYRIDPEAGLG
jgi:O-antigen biosynthesis protein